MRYIDEITLPEGWEWMLVSTARSKQDETPTYAASSNGTLANEIEGEFFTPVPVTVEAAEEAFDGYSTKVQTPDGKIEIAGVVGAAVRKFAAGHETVRAEVRDGNITTPEALQQALYDNVFNKGRKQRTVSEDELEAVQDDPDALKAFLRSKGLLK